MAAAQARNLAGVMEMFAADATMNFDGTIQQGLDEIQAAEEANWAALPDSTIEWTAGVVVVAAAGDMAHERGTWIFHPDGPGEAAEIAGDYVTVWQKIGGQWKVVIDVGSARKAASEDETGE
jgi:ketosteroid isomerase-like protein